MWATQIKKPTHPGNRTSRKFALRIAARFWISTSVLAASVPVRSRRPYLEKSAKQCSSFFPRRKSRFYKRFFCFHFIGFFPERRFAEATFNSWGSLNRGWSCRGSRRVSSQYRAEYVQCQALKGASTWDSDPQARMKWRSPRIVFSSNPDHPPNRTHQSCYHQVSYQSICFYSQKQSSLFTYHDIHL